MFALLVALAIYGSGAHFPPSLAYWRMMLVPVIAGSAVLAFALYRLSAAAASERSDGGGDAPFERLIRGRAVGIVGPIVASAIVYPALQFGAPALASNFIDGKTEQASLVVRDPTGPQVSALCSGQVNVSHPDYGDASMCGISSEIKHSAEPGDRIQISGQVSYLGVRYQTCLLVKNSK